MNALYDQLLKHERDLLRQYQREAGVTSASLKPRMALLWDWQGYERSVGNTEEGIAARLTAYANLYPDWTPEQVSTAAAIHTFAGAVGQDLGIARRIIHNDPAELALGVWLGTRYEWLRRRLEEQAGMGTADDDLFVAELALPVMDTALIRRVIEAPNLERDPHRKLLYEGIVAAFQRDLPHLRSVVLRFNKGKVHRAYQGMRGVLSGIAQEDPVQVAAGLGEILEDENHCRKRKEGRIISLEAHQFYRLAEWVAPELVAHFDVHQGLPWDADFHLFTQAYPAVLAELDLSDISPLIHAALIHLQLPDWWRPIGEPEFGTDVCRLTLTSLGPNPARVEELLAIWMGVRKWPMPDLSRLPVVLAAEASRVAVSSVARALREVGASARFEKISDLRPTP